MRLGVYVDGPYGVVETDAGPRVAPDLADAPFLTFVNEVGTHFESVLLFGRAQPLPDPGDRALLPANVAIEPLPQYRDLRQVGKVVRATTGTAKGFWRGLARMDVVWIFGPHPFSFLLAGLALLRRKRVVLGVRQDTIAYFKGRMTGRGTKPALVGVRALDACFRLLARGTPVTVVGAENARRYARARSLLQMSVSLVRREDLARGPVDRDVSDEVRLLTVGRVDREKNPLLLVDAIAALECRYPGKYRLVWVGTGPLEGLVRERATALGVNGAIEQLGFVPFGPALIARYQTADAFVHVSLTEGVPAVLLEALATGTPIVGTDVGGVAAALDHGRAGLLVPPNDPDALVSAIVRITQDRELSKRLVERGLDLVEGLTLDVQAERVARFLSDAASRSARKAVPD